MSLTPLPFLQPTFTRRQLLPIIEKHEEAKKHHQDNLWKTFKVKVRLGGISLIGSSETTIYLVTTSLILLIGCFSENVRKKKTHSIQFIKGGLSATYLSVYAIGGTTGSHKLIAQIETKADKQFKSLLLKSESRFEKTLDQARKERISQFLRRNQNPAALKPSIWDKQAIEARQKLKELIQSLNATYPSIKSERKYRLLTDTKKNVREIVNSINYFTI